jgi:large subunit ribosomal protein L1
MQQLKTTGGKKIRAAREKIDPVKLYTAQEAINLLKSVAFTKFDQTLDVVLKLGVDPRHSDQMVRGMVSLPAGTGKTVRVAVFCKDDKIEAAKAAGADLIGSTELIESIKAGKIDFDICIATPDMMATIGQVAKILGPKGMMPNPKLGTVTPDVATAVRNAKSGQVEFRVEKAGIIHAGIGKISFGESDLFSNLKALVDAIQKAKPSGAKGTYMKQVFLSSTMGPSLRLDIASIQ